MEVPDEYVDQAKAAISSIDCKFTFSSQNSSDAQRLLYRSDNCLLGGKYVRLYRVDDKKFRYSLNSSFFSDEKYSSVGSINLRVDVPGMVVDTNGMKINMSEASFYVNPTDPEPKTFYVEYGPPCSSDADCMSDQECVGGDCQEISCPECSYVKDKECIPYECCEPYDCGDGQECLNNTCSAITCECGFVSDHQCVKYGCCSDIDCGSRRFCDNHTCSDIECVNDGECAQTQRCERYKCLNLNCMEDESYTDHSCKKLQCGILTVPKNHGCQTDTMLVAAIILAIILVLAVALSLALVMKVRSDNTVTQSRPSDHSTSQNKP
jgi:hypothetical protein